MSSTRRALANAQQLLSCWCAGNDFTTPASSSEGTQGQRSPPKVYAKGREGEETRREKKENHLLVTESEL